MNQQDASFEAGDWLLEKAGVRTMLGRVGQLMRPLAAGTEWDEGVRQLRARSERDHVNGWSRRDGELKCEALYRAPRQNEQGAS